MPPVEIKPKNHQAAYTFTCDAWRRTHPESTTAEGTVYPGFFSGKAEAYINPLYRFVWGSRIIVASLQVSQLQQATYEQLLRPTLASPLYPLTISAIQYLTNYATLRENNVFNRDASISHPRNQIIVYLCTKLSELESRQINPSLITAYSQEFQFIDLLLQNAHEFFPTSSTNNGRRGFHAILMNTQECIKELQRVVRSQLERKTLKEHVNELTQLTHALKLDTGRFIAHSINDVLTEQLNLHHFSSEYHAGLFDPYAKSGIGQWMIQLLTYQDNPPSNNPWLEETALSVKTLVEHEQPGIPKVFIENAPLMTAFCELHGLVFELQQLEKLLTQLEEAAGLSGDYSMAHNEVLFNSLMHSILCSEKLGARSRLLIEQIAQAQQTEIKKAPAKNPTWVVQYRFARSIQANILDNITAQSPKTIQDIMSSTSKLRQLGYGEYQRKIENIINSTHDFVMRLYRLNIVSEHELSAHQSKKPATQDPDTAQHPSIPNKKDLTPKKSASPRLAYTPYEPLALPHNIDINSDECVALLLQEIIEKVFFDLSRYAPSHRQHGIILSRHLDFLFNEKQTSPEAQSEKLKELSFNLKKLGRKFPGQPSIFITHFDKVSQSFSLPKNKSGSNRIISKMICLSQWMHCLNLLTHYCTILNKLFLNITEIINEQEKISQKTKLDEELSSSKFSTLSRQHTALDAALNELEQHPWHQPSFHKFIIQKYSSNTNNDEGEKILELATAHFQIATASAKSIMVDNPYDKVWPSLIEFITSHVVDPALNDARNWLHSNRSKIDHADDIIKPESSWLISKQLIIKTEQLKKTVKHPPEEYQDKPRQLNLKNVKAILSISEDASDAEMLSSLKHLNTLLIKQSWHVVRLAGVGGQCIYHNDTQHILPQHIYEIVMTINKALEGKADPFVAYEDIISIAKKALLFSRKPLGLFASWRDPLAQAVYEQLEKQEVFLHQKNTTEQVYDA